VRVVLYLHNTSRGFEIERTPVEARPFEPGGGVVLHAGPEASGGRLILHQELRRAKEHRRGRGGFCGRSVWGADTFRFGDPADTAAVEYAHAYSGIGGFGLEIVEQVAIPVEKCSQVG